MVLLACYAKDKNELHIHISFHVHVYSQKFYTNAFHSPLRKLQLLSIVGGKRSFKSGSEIRIYQLW